MHRLVPILESKNLQTQLLECLIGSKIFLHTLLHSERIPDFSSGLKEIVIPTCMWTVIESGMWNRWRADIKRE